jgi:anti-sigma28 factor (negative regulator of flagellin synthesis)
MSDADHNEAYYATLGLPPDATLAQVKTRYKELNNAYLKILELSRKGSAHTTSQTTSVSGNAIQVDLQPNADSGQSASSQEARTEPIAALKEKLAKGKIDKTQFERLAKARYAYLTSKPFSELSDSEFEERLHGFEGLKVDLK